jgi:hypothetical protein
MESLIEAMRMTPCVLLRGYVPVPLWDASPDAIPVLMEAIRVGVAVDVPAA